MEDRLRRWADVTSACLALRRAAIRARRPRSTDREVEAQLRRELDRARRDSLAAYRRNA